MRIFIFANGGENIGMGHIMRTLVLAKELKKSFEIMYIVSKKDEFKAGLKKIKEEKFEWKYEEDIDIRVNDIVIIDRYDMEVADLIKLKKKRCLVMLFDDNNRLEEYPIDIVFNQNIYAEKMNYKKQKETKYLLGEKYILLREEFLKYRKIEIKDSIENIMITVGGSDNKNLTKQIVKELQNLNYKIHVIIGGAFKNKNKLKENFIKNENIIFYENANMPQVMSKMDLCIAACGSTIYELSFLGIPTIGLVIAENQRDMARYLEDKKIVNIEEIENLRIAITKMNFKKRIKLSEKMQVLIDGNGKERIKKEIIESYNEFKNKLS